MTAAVTYWLLLKVFASGCTALTGVEAVSNGVKAFREPAVKNAQRTLTVIIFLLAVLLAEFPISCKVYGIAATDPGQPGYQSVLSMLIAAVFGKGIFYYLTIASILFVLSLSANTAFADFPRLCRAIAQNNYLPHAFAYRGRRLVYTYGIVVLAILCGGLLILFGGVTDRLIPLYAVGAFLAFTLSQAGMVVHWRKEARPALVEERDGQRARRVRHRDHRRGRAGCEIRGRRVDHGDFYSVDDFFLHLRSPPLSRRKLLTTCKIPVQVANLSQSPIVVIPIDRWSKITRQGIEFAARLSTGGDRPARGGLPTIPNCFRRMGALR